MRDVVVLAKLVESKHITEIGKARKRSERGEGLAVYEGSRSD